MSSRKPASFRYFKARLLALGRPAVWIPALALTLVAAFLLEYTTNPTWLTGSDDAELGPEQSGLGDTLSEDALRAAADIDNLEVLSNDLQSNPEASEQDQADDADNANVAQSREPSAGERYLASRDRNNSNPANTRSSSTNLPEPFTTASNGNTGSNPYLFSLGLFDNAEQGTTAPSTIATSSPLERAIRDQQFRSAATADGSAETAPTDNPQSADAATQSLTAADSSTSLDSGITGTQTSLPPSISFIPNSPTMSPPPGTTGYTLPPALVPVNPAGSSANAYSTSVAPMPGLSTPQTSVPPIPSIGNTFNPVPNITNVGVFGPTISQPLGATSSQATPQAAPFSASRRQPGRNIGNGEINTFSNP